MRTAIIITVGLVLIFGIPVILLIDAKYKEQRDFQCTKCFYKFDIVGNQLNSYRINGKLHVKCPKCGKYSVARVIRKE